MKIVKGFFDTIIGITLGGEMIKLVDNTPSIPSGIGKATQTFIGLGVLGNAAKHTKLLRFK